MGRKGICFKAPEGKEGAAAHAEMHLLEAVVAAMAGVS